MRSINDYRCLDCSSLCNRCPHLSLNLEIRNPRLLLFKKCGIPTSTGDKNKCPLRPYLIYTNDLVRKRKFLKFTFFIFYVKGVFSKSNLDKKFCGWTFTDEELSRASSTLTSLSPGDTIQDHCDVVCAHGHRTAPFALSYGSVNWPHRRRVERPTIATVTESRQSTRAPWTAHSTPTPTSSRTDRTRKPFTPTN